MKKHLLICISYFCLIIQLVSAQSSQGPNSAGYASQPPCGFCQQAPWTDVENVYASDSVFAVCHLADYGTVFEDGAYFTVPMFVGQFGFNVPSTATINGLIIEIEKKAESNNTIMDSVVQLFYGSSMGSNLALTEKWHKPKAYSIYGDTTSLWGASLTPAIVNDPNFGIHIIPLNTSPNFRYGYIDHVRATVFYTEVPTGIKQSTINQGEKLNAFINSTEQLSLSYTLDKQNQNCDIKIYNMLGEEVYSKKLNDISKGSHTENINISALHSGIYILRLISDKDEATRKITISK
jgi:hypothetical protein